MASCNVRAIFGSAFVTVLLSHGALAQLANPASTSDSPLAQPTYVAPRHSAAFEDYLFDLRPLGKPLGRSLASQGIYVTGRSIDEGFGNVSGGLKRGGLFEGFTSLGVDLDMNRIAGIQGGAVHFLANDLSGRPYQQFSGSAYAFNRVFSIDRGLRLNELSYEQSLFNNILDVRIGRVPVGTEFDYSDVYCQFITGLCAAPGAFAFGKGYPPYLVASYGAVARVNLPHSFYFNAAIYEDEPSLSTVGHYGWPGEDWEFNKAKGATIPIQLGYQTTYANDPYPRSYDIGAFYDTMAYTDPLLNTLGQNRLVSGGSPKMDRGKSQIWLQAEQVVWRPDMESQRGLDVFAGANFTPSGEPNINNAFFVGFSMRGLFPERANDTINFEGQIINLNSRFTQSVNSEFDLRGLPQNAKGTESFVELNYGISLAPGIVLKPFFQYIFNPDQSGIARPSPTNDHVVFAGGMVSISFPEALGLPRMPKPGT